MKDAEKTAKKVIDSEDKGLSAIADEVFDGVKAGVKAGIYEGLKKGVEEGLKECIAKGTGNVGADDYRKLCLDLGSGALKEAVKQGAKPLFDRPAKEFVDRICPRLGDELAGQNVFASDVGMDFIRDIALQREKEIFDKMTSRLPKNPLFKPVIDGLGEALKDSLSARLKDCQKVVIVRMKNREGGGGHDS